MSNGAKPPAPAGNTPAATVGWPRVKQILDGAIAGWKAKHHHDPDLTGVHGDTFGWDTKDRLKAAEALEFRLIDPAQAPDPFIAHELRRPQRLAGGLLVPLDALE